MAGPSDATLPPLDPTQRYYIKPDGTPYTRIEMEKYLRDEIRVPNSWRRFLNRFYNLPSTTSYGSGARPLFALHMLLDQMVRAGHVSGEDLGVQPETALNEQLLQAFTYRLTQAVQSGQAMPPKEGEIEMNGQPPAPPAGYPPPPPPQYQQPAPPAAPPPPQYQQPPQQQYAPPPQAAAPPAPPPPQYGTAPPPPPAQAGPPPQGAPPATPSPRRSRKASSEAAPPPPAAPVPPVGAPQPPMQQQAPAPPMQAGPPPGYPQQQYAPSPQPQMNQAPDIGSLLGAIAELKQMVSAQDAKIQDLRAQLNEVTRFNAMAGNVLTPLFNEWWNGPKQAKLANDGTDYNLEAYLQKIGFPLPPK